MSKYGRCSICKTDFGSCSHSFQDVQAHQQRTKETRRRLKKVTLLLKDVADDAPITKAQLLQIIERL